jgi:serine/threonine protein kinase
MSLVPVNHSPNWMVVLRDNPNGTLVLFNRASKELAIVNEVAGGNSANIGHFSNNDETRDIGQRLLEYPYNDHAAALIGEGSLVHGQPVCPSCNQLVYYRNRHNSNSSTGSNNSNQGSRSKENATNGSGADFGSLTMHNHTHSHLGSAGIVTRDTNYFKLLENISATNSRTSTPLHDSEPFHRFFEGDKSQAPGMSNANDPISGVNELPKYSSISSSAFSQGYFERFFRTKHQLGKGSRGVVFLVEHILDGYSLGFFALKKVAVGDDHKWLQKVLTEVHLLRLLNHPNLVSYNHMWLENSRLSKFAPEVPCAYILQEYCDGGTLEDYVLEARARDASPLPALDVLRLFRDIVRGVSHLHLHQIIHRDLKPSNCLLMTSKADATAGANNINGLRNSGGFNHLPRVLVSDFGEGQMEGLLRTGTGTTGTLEYCAPELLQLGPHTHQFCKRTDVFSLGMILYFLCFGGDLPYPSAGMDQSRSTGMVRTPSEEFDRLKDQVLNFPGFDSSLSQRLHHRSRHHAENATVFADLLSLMLAREQKTRPLTEEILDILDTLEARITSAAPPSDSPVLTQNSVFIEEHVDDGFAGSSLSLSTPFARRAIEPARKEPDISATDTNHTLLSQQRRSWLPSHYPLFLKQLHSTASGTLAKLVVVGVKLYVLRHHSTNVPTLVLNALYILVGVDITLHTSAVVRRRYLFASLLTHILIIYTFAGSIV